MATLGKAGELGEYPFHCCSPLVPSSDKEGSHIEVILDCHLGKDYASLGNVAYAEGRNAVGWQVGDNLAIEEDAPGSGRLQAYHGFDYGRFTCTIRANDGDDFSRIYLYIDTK
jgi:hypothetical protein